MTRIAFAFAFALVACTSPEAAPVAAPAQVAPIAGPIACCADAAAIRAADGKRVVVVGAYRPIRMVMRALTPGELPPIDRDARTVSLALDSTEAVMLGIYYAPEAARPLDEIARFTGKRVRVVGTLHARTPTQVVDHVEMQTMIGPYIDVEALADAE